MDPLGSPTHQFGFLMNTTRFDLELARLLGDASGALYSANLRTTAMYAAVREYSRYFPVKRQFGTGALYSAATTGDTTITVIGGPFAIGDTVKIDPFFGLETRTVTGVAVASDSAEGISTEVTLTLSSALLSNHALGVLVGKSTTGLALVSQTSQYALPFDFTKWDLASFDLATGQRSAVKKFEAFNDKVYRFSEAIGGVGLGASQGFSGPFGSGGLIALPTGANSIIVAAGLGVESLFTVTAGVPPFLTITPVPVVTQTLDPIFYFGQHTPASVPDAEMQALECYAAYAAIMARLSAIGYVAGMANFGGFAGKLKNDDMDVDFDAASGIKALLDASAAYLKRWERMIASRPYATSG